MKCPQCMSENIRIGAYLFINFKIKENSLIPVENKDNLLQACNTDPSKAQISCMEEDCGITEEISLPDNLSINY
ncbi:MAG: hypothetical protein GY909_16130 [Oligoflexia bacterium]|nr:hypothetical protein [Oligoflexia bacterium]